MECKCEIRLPDAIVTFSAPKNVAIALELPPAYVEVNRLGEVSRPASTAPPQFGTPTVVASPPEP